MNLKDTARALPTLVRIGVAEAVAYRAEMLVWVLSTTMPLVMMALWTAVAADGGVGRFGKAEFVAYFLATFIVRQLTGSWAAWEMNFEVRTGAMSMRLMRPIHPVVTYAVENLSVVPMRVMVSLPVAAIALLTVGASMLPKTALYWVIWAASMLGGWAITFLANVVIGTLSMFMQSSIKVMEVYFMGFLVLSGYLFPLELLPPAVAAAVDWLPFRYQIGLPVELLTSAHSTEAALRLLGMQWAWVVALAVLFWVTWKQGLKRYGAFGG